MSNYWGYEDYSLYKGLIAGLKTKFDKSYFGVWNPWLLDKSQWFSEEEIRMLQLEGLQKLFEHARRNTKYYRNLPKNLYVCTVSLETLSNR